LTDEAHGILMTTGKERTNFLMHNFCVACGNKLELLQLPTEDRPRLVCSGCGHVHYINPKVVSGVLAVDSDRVWLLRRAIEPRLGYWTYPAGFQEWDETTEEAAIRETREEIGCDVQLDGLFGVYSRANAPVVNVVYLARLIPPHDMPSVSTEALEVRAFAHHDIPWPDLAFPSTRDILGDWVNQVSQKRPPRRGQ
jgi:ADP-ribose pyrophosphatase YjhB (NUDIX family)